MTRTATGLVLLLWPFAALAEPSFDCTKAESSAEEAVCASDALAALDVEVSRLFGLALNGPNQADAATLKAYQRGWIKGRDDCWKADNLERCVRDSYALRIDELRRENADARAEEGGSTGPFAYVCEGIDAGVSASFIQAGDPLAVLRWRETVLVLGLAPSGSGARYQGDEAGFWSKGDEAVLTFEGQDHACRLDDIG